MQASRAGVWKCPVAREVQGVPGLVEEEMRCVVMSVENLAILLENVAYELVLEEREEVVGAAVDHLHGIEEARVMVMEALVEAIHHGEVVLLAGVDLLLAVDEAQVALLLPVADLQQETLPLCPDIVVAAALGLLDEFSLVCLSSAEFKDKEPLANACLTWHVFLSAEKFCCILESHSLLRLPFGTLKNPTIERS